MGLTKYRLANMPWLPTLSVFTVSRRWLIDGGRGAAPHLVALLFPA